MESHMSKFWCPNKISQWDQSQWVVTTSTCDLSLWNQASWPSPYEIVSKYKCVTNSCTHVIIGYPEPKITIVHEFEIYCNQWNRDKCFYSTLWLWTHGNFAWESTQPTSFILRPTSLLRPKSYDHTTSKICPTQKSPKPICPTQIRPTLLCPTLFWPTLLCPKLLCPTQLCPTLFCPMLLCPTLLRRESFHVKRVNLFFMLIWPSCYLS